MAKDSPAGDKLTIPRSEAATILGRHFGSPSKAQDGSILSMEIKRLTKHDRKELDRETTELVESRNTLASELAKWADHSSHAPAALMGQSAELHLREMRHLQKLTKKLGEAELLYSIRPGNKESIAWDFIRNLAAQFRTHLGPRLGDGLTHDEEKTWPSDPDSDFDDPALGQVRLANVEENTSIGDENQDAKRKRMHESELPSKKSKLEPDAVSLPLEMDEHSNPRNAEPSVPMGLGSPMDSILFSPEKKDVQMKGTSPENESVGDNVHEGQKVTKKKNKREEKKRKSHKKKSKKKKTTTAQDAGDDGQKVDSEVEMLTVDEGHREGEQKIEKTGNDQDKKEQLENGPQESRSEKDGIASSAGFQRLSTTAIPVHDYTRNSPATTFTPTKLPRGVKDAGSSRGGYRRWEPSSRPYAPLFSSKELGQQAEVTMEASTPSGFKRKDEEQLSKSGARGIMTMAIGPVDGLHIGNEVMTSPIEAHIKNLKASRSKGNKSNDKDAGASTPQAAAAAAVPTAVQLPSSAGGGDDLVRALTPSSRAIDKFAIDSQDAERRRAKLQELLRRDYEVLSQERKEWFRVMNFEQR